MRKLLDVHHLDFGDGFRGIYILTYIYQNLKIIYLIYVFAAYQLFCNSNRIKKKSQRGRESGKEEGKKGKKRGREGMRERGRLAT